MQICFGECLLLPGTVPVAARSSRIRGNIQCGNLAILYELGNIGLVAKLNDLDKRYAELSRK
jgi:hypothetical protein